MYLSIKLVHIISAILLFGTGFGSAFYMYMVYRSGDMQAMAQTNRIVVIADNVFTAPCIFLQILSGFLLFSYSPIDWSSPWIWWVMVLMVFVGACWLPVVWLQIRLRNLAATLEQPTADYRTLMNIWLVLGLLAFPAVVVLYAFMVFKPFWS